LIAAETFRTLGSRAVVEAVPPLQVKGKRDPVTAYVLHRLSAPSPRGG
jgi:class 3 adenylate cyclase